MVWKCRIPSCKSTHKKFKLFCVPFGNKERWAEWKKACPFFETFDHRQLENLRICKLHFLPHFISEQNKLTKDAIPTLNLTPPLDETPCVPKDVVPTLNLTPPLDKTPSVSKVDDGVNDIQKTHECLANLLRNTQVIGADNAKEKNSKVENEKCDKRFEFIQSPEYIKNKIAEIEIAPEKHVNVEHKGISNPVASVADTNFEAVCGNEHAEIEADCEVVLDDKIFEEIKSFILDKDNSSGPKEIRVSQDNLWKSIRKKVYLSQLCRTCLATGVTYSLKTGVVADAFKILMGNTIKDNEPHNVCWYCGVRLMSALRFYEQAARAQALLLELMEEQNPIDLLEVKSSQRSEHNLTSELSCISSQLVNIPATNNLISTFSFPKALSMAFKNKSAPRKRSLNEVNLDENKENLSRDYVNVLLDKAEHEADDVSIDGASVQTKEQSLDEANDEYALPSSAITPKLTIDQYQKLPYKDMFTIKKLSFQKGIDNFSMLVDYEKGRPFQCAVCSRSYRTKDLFDKHMMCHSDEGKAHECSVCKIRLKHVKYLKKHYETHFRKLKCNLCDFVTTKSTEAISHYARHKGINFECNCCSRAFTKLSSLIAHKRMHSRTSRYSCEYCGLAFPLHRLLDTHRLIEHKDMRRKVKVLMVYCDVCLKYFASKEAYRVHKKMSALHELKRKKIQRNKRVRKKANEIVPINCEECGVSLPNLRRYYNHFTAHHPNQTYPSAKCFVCETCGKTFSLKVLFRSHMMTHSETPPYICDVCAKGFYVKGNLKAHLKVHLKERPYKLCQICSKKVIGSLAHHLMTHKDNIIQPVQCPVCKKIFGKRLYLKKHMRRVHRPL